MSASSVGHARIWAWREEMGDVYTGEWAPEGDKNAPMEAEAYILATPSALAASPEGAALIREAEARGMERAERIAVGIAESCAGNVTVYSPPMAGAHEELRLLHTGGEQACWQVVGAIRAEAAAIRAAKGEPE